MAKASKNVSGHVLSKDRAKSKLIPSVSAKNESQKTTIKAIASPENDIIIVSGIAGSGKTYLSASWGLGELMKGKYERMIITRPYVEAGEKLGYLPTERMTTR